MRNYAGTREGICSHSLVYNFLILLLRLQSSVFVAHFSNAFTRGNDAFPKVSSQNEVVPLLVILSHIANRQECENVFTLVTLFTLIKIKIFHLCRTRVIYVALVSFVLRSRCARVALALYLCRSCRASVARVWHSCYKIEQIKNYINHTTIRKIKESYSAIVPDSFYFKSVSLDDVKKEVRNLNTKKSSICGEAANEVVL